MTPCTQPHCTRPSVHSLNGLVAGRFEARCLQHATITQARLVETEVTYLEALTRLPVRGQLQLVPDGAA